MSDPTTTSGSTSSSAVAGVTPGIGPTSSAAATASAAGQLGRRLGPVEIQAFWQHSFSRVLTEVAAVLLTRSAGGAASSNALAAPPAPSVPPAPAAAAEMRLRPSFDNPVMKSRVSSLLHFFATNSKWGVVELLTSHVYGYGSSARAMYTSKVLDEAQAAIAAAAAAAADAVHGSAAAPAEAPAEAPAGPTSPGAADSPSPFAQVQSTGNASGEIQEEVQPSDPSGQQGSSSSGTAAAAAACVLSAAPSVRSEGGVSSASAVAVHTAKGPAQRGLLKLLRVKFKQAVGK